MKKNRYFLIYILLIIHSREGISQYNWKLTYPAKFKIEMIAPVLVERTTADSWFIDFGKDAFGTMVLNLNSEIADTLIIGLGEKLSSPRVIDRSPGGTIRYQKVKLAINPEVKEYVLQLPPDKRNTNPPAVSLPPSFGVITPFRYCEIENLKTDLFTDNIKQKAFFYTFNEDASYFTSSDTILNQVWDLCKYSIKATSFCGLYIDGDRERIPYEGDALINQLSHYSVDAEYSLAKRTNEYFMSHPTWPTEWILHTVILFYYDYLYTGDPALLIKYYDALKTKTLIELEREDGLISVKSEKLNDDLMGRLGFKDTKQRLRDIVDWPPAQKDTGWKLVTAEGERDGYEMADINTVVNVFHYYNLKLMSEMAGWLGKKDDSEFFMKRSQLVKKSINDKLFDTRKGIYTDGENSTHSSLHANMFPLAFGLVPEKHIGTVTDFIITRGMACSVYGAQHLLDGLYGAGASDYAFELLTSTAGRSWWNMIRSGSTITLEAWDMKYKPNSDWNHAWGAAPANIITRQLWGIRPVTPGFSRVIINPQLGKLSSTQIIVPTIKGAIRASYKRVSFNADLFSIDIPDGISADFVIPTKMFRSVQINNEKAIALKGIVKLKAGHNNIEIVN
jgi:alpha-L-rhamnosidase